MSREKSFGIDFGTTTSSAVWYQTAGTTRKYQRYGEDDMPIPSVVAIDRETGTVQTGREARAHREELVSSCECISSIKTVLNDREWNKEIAGVTWRPVNIASRVFGALRDSTSGYLDRATLAIPVGLGSMARRTLREAAKTVGIEVEAFVSESTAAFFASYDELQSAENVAVFDWGGGTLDVSVIRHSRGRIEEIATNNLDKAGDHIDETLARRVHSELAREKGVDIPFDDMTAKDRDSLIYRCEAAKIALSTEDNAMVRIFGYGPLGRVRKDINYEWFEGIVAPIVDEALECFDEAIREAGLSPYGLDRVILVGGSSYLRPLRNKMFERFGDRLFFPDNPEWSISRGAALLSRYPGSYVAAQDVSIILSDGTPYYLLRRGEEVGSKRKSAEFGITDTSEMVRVVFSGSRDIDNDTSRFQIREMPGYGFLEERFRLEYWVDDDLVFRVRMSSNMRPESDVWEYGKLKLSYDLNGGRR